MHIIKLLLYMKKKSDNRVILEIKLSFNQRDLNEKDFIVLFEISSSRFICKLSLRSNLGLLESVAKMLNSAKFKAHLHCNKWSGIAAC